MSAVTPNALVARCEVPAHFLRWCEDAESATCVVVVPSTTARGQPNQREIALDEQPNKHGNNDAYIVKTEYEKKKGGGGGGTQTRNKSRGKASKTPGKGRAKRRLAERRRQKGRKETPRERALQLYHTSLPGDMENSLPSRRSITEAVQFFGFPKRELRKEKLKRKKKQGDARRKSLRGRSRERDATEHPDWLPTLAYRSMSTSFFCFLFLRFCKRVFATRTERENSRRSRGLASDL